jgi:hypothetical protein
MACSWNNAWNWKCALLSAVARSAVYAVALARLGANSPAWRDGLAVVAVELMYVTLTAGLYAGLQQQALGLRRRWLGDLAIVVGVPGLSQLVDWGVHWLAGAPTPHKALATVLGFTLLSALFHRHVMRHGTFLTGKHGGSLIQDFRRIPALVASFALWPMRLARRLPQRLGYAAKLAA